MENRSFSLGTSVTTMFGAVFTSVTDLHTLCSILALLAGAILSLVLATCHIYKTFIKKQ